MITALPHLVAALALGLASASLALGLASASLAHDLRRLRDMLAGGMLEELPAHGY